MTNCNMQISRHLLPEDDAVTRPVQDLWRKCFGEGEVTETRGQFAGEETDVDDDILYVLSVDGRLASCCHITRRKGTGMGGLGCVATVSEFRGRGLSREICSYALRDFDESGGDVIWLGTSNPVAANLYHSLGFSFLPGTQVMRRMREGLTDTRFLDGFFKGSTTCVKRGSAAFRIPMIPLMTSRLGFAVMDCVAGFCGSENIVECSCMGLFPAYESIRTSNGDWCCLDCGDGRIGGLGSWKTLSNGVAMVDGFWHSNFRAGAPELFRALVEEAKTAASRVIMPVADVDAAKAEVAAELGAAKGPERLWQACRGFVVPMHDYVIA